ncbi:hypothetical protein [Deinococcus aquatilis]|uniref:hypothetical protein n=1 Tax=Deinococcus aquatilis TaxID=519440 RepID=UPI0012FBB5D5|nr:hypothetical protein [Deinococcus aquatilis]
MSHAAPLAPAAPATTPYMGGNITREYRAEDLKTSYGILNVGMGEIWVLNLPDTVVDVITSKDGVLQFKQTGSRVIVGALASSGSYPVLVMTQDSVFFFQARLNPSRGGGVRNIVVRADQAPDDEQVLPGFPSAPATPMGAVTPKPAPQPVSPSGSGRAPFSLPVSALAAVTTPALSLPAPLPVPVSVTPAPVVSAPVVRPPAPVATPAVLPPAPVVTPAVLPPAPVVLAPAPVLTPPPTADPAATSSLTAVQARFTAAIDGTDTVLNWRVRNDTEGDLLLNERALRVSGVNGPAIYQATRASVRVAPGKTEYGTVVVKGMLDPVLNVQWAAARFGLGQSVTLTQRVSVGGAGAWLAPR